MNAAALDDSSSAATRVQRRELQDRQRAQKKLKQMDGSSATRLLIARHGETNWNREGRLQGQTDDATTLNELGQLQASALADRLKGEGIAALYSSDLARCLQTAGAIARHHELQVRPRQDLRERKLGVLEGVKREDAPKEHPLAWRCLTSLSSSAAIPGGGESMDMLRQRCVQACEDIASQHPGQTVLIVTHGGPLNAIYHKATGQVAKFKMINCSVSEVYVVGSLWAGKMWNDVTHLQSVDFMAAAVGGGASGG